jgi:hypothetical protein
VESPAPDPAVVHPTALALTAEGVFGHAGLAVPPALLLLCGVRDDRGLAPSESLDARLQEPI